jgi:hypothetical protein
MIFLGSNLEKSHPSLIDFKTIGARFKISCEAAHFKLLHFIFKLAHEAELANPR